VAASWAGLDVDAPAVAMPVYMAGWWPAAREGSRNDFGSRSIAQRISDGQLPLAQCTDGRRPEKRCQVR
jgi:hypothetical protein